MVKKMMKTAYVFCAGRMTSSTPMTNSPSALVVIHGGSRYGLEKAVKVARRMTP